MRVGKAKEGQKGEMVRKIFMAMGEAGGVTVILVE